MKTVKITKKSDEEMGLAYDVDAPRYPYGTELCFRDEVMDQLGVAGLNVGDTVKMTVTAVVVAKHENVSEREGEDARSDRGIDLQVTEVGVMPAAETKKDKADKLYG